MADSPVLLLDTHAWIWLLDGKSATFTPSTLAAITTAAAHACLMVSAISVWEVGMLEAKNRIVFGKNCYDWVTDALAVPGIVLVPLEPDIAIASSRLPGEFHGDPADRILVATARRKNAIIVTNDRKIQAYGAQNHVKVMAL